MINELVCGQGLTRSLLLRSFSQLSFFSVRFQNGRGSFSPPYFFSVSYMLLCRQATFPWDLRGTIWYQWYQIILHALISKISCIATAWTASIIIFSAFLIEIFRANQMQARMQPVIQYIPRLLLAPVSPLKNRISHSGILNIFFTRSGGGCKPKRTLACLSLFWVLLVSPAEKERTDLRRSDRKFREGKRGESSQPLPSQSNSLITKKRKV